MFAIKKKKQDLYLCGFEDDNCHAVVSIWKPSEKKAIRYEHQKDAEEAMKHLHDCRVVIVDETRKNGRRKKDV